MNFRLSSYCSAALVAASVFLAPQVTAAESGEGIVVYNAQHENLVKSWVDGFTKETGIKVTLRNGGDSELGNQLVQEGAASPADVFLTENSRQWSRRQCKIIRAAERRHLKSGGAGISP